MQQKDLYDGIDQDAWNYRFVSPFSWVISGSSGAGKSFMLPSLLKITRDLLCRNKNVYWSRIGINKGCMMILATILIPDS